MSDDILRIRHAIDTDALLFGARINVYGFGLMALWTTINTTVLPDRVTATAPDSRKGSALGLITFLGVGLAVIARFVFMFGAYPAQRYLLLFLRDRFGDDTERLASIGVTLAVAVAVVSATVAGLLSDLAGRVPVLRRAAMAGGLGILATGFAHTGPIVGLAGAMIAIGYGAFLAVNWALLTDEVPEGQAAAALGVANIATAGAGAITGVFGPVVDVMNAVLPEGTYQTLFGLAGIIALLSLLPLERLDRGRG